MVKSKLIAALAMLAIACGNMNDIETQTEDVDSVATPLISVRSKTCSVDGNHWAEVNANVNSAGMMTSYSIKYKTSGGWRLALATTSMLAVMGRFSTTHRILACLIRHVIDPCQIAELAV